MIIDIENDTFLCKFPVVIDISGNNDLSVHEVSIFTTELSNGLTRDYFLFDPKAGKAVMNYKVEHHEKLEKIIPVKNYNIFQYDYDKEAANIIKILNHYRQENLDDDKQKV